MSVNMYLGLGLDELEGVLHVRVKVHRVGLGERRKRLRPRAQVPQRLALGFQGLGAVRVERERGVAVGDGRGGPLELERALGPRSVRKMPSP